MKTITILAFLALAGFSSCKKCYTCSDGLTYCKGSGVYEAIRTNQPPTDINGHEMSCY